ncbi:MarP family serine protease [Rothia nasimurium]|uniref:MarP family serine protease n=1 Tax=Rothia nasimurium TaxID=85336 RepID=UPI003BA3CB7B
MERFLGGLLNLGLSALVIVTVVLVVRPLGIPLVTAATAESKVISSMMKVVPPEAQDLVTQMRSSIVHAAGLPEISQLLYPEQEAPTEALETPELTEASKSVVQIVGTAPACNFVSEGSGFVVGGGLVVTNAHVVSGIDTPSVLGRGGEAATGRVIYYNLEEDIAILSAPSFPVAGLTVDSTEIPAGTNVAFMGFPGGGPFSNRAATVQGLGYTQTVNAETGEPNPSRQVYQLAAQVEQGNSGGPVLTADGRVMAMIFAKSTESQTGYAIPARTIIEALNTVNADSPAVTTGQCAA